MEYIKKEELIEGEIYKVQEGNFSMIGLITLIDNGNNDLYSKRGNATYITTINQFRKNSCWCYMGTNRNIINATPEEKHWLNEAIKLDKFITFEEAMKTFISEYYEYIHKEDSSWKIGKIYKVNNDGSFNFESGRVCEYGNYYKNSNYFKPSTKEAYDAQFVVKEPKFVLPEKWYIIPTNETNDILIKYRGGNYTGNNSVLRYDQTDQSHPKCWKRIDLISKDFIEITFEQFKKYVLEEEIIEEKVIEEPVIENKTKLEIWLENTKSLNLTLIGLTGYIGSSSICDYNDIFTKLEGRYSEDKAKILFSKWNNQTIEPLPQFKIIETIETITKVENNEGNQFFIGDVVISSNGTVQTIESFDYNKAKTNIIAFTNKQSILGNGIGIDKIEHYIEPKTDYKILEYKTEGGISCKAPFLADSHQFYINERCKIYSIKRISDDLIITVGDEVLSKTCGVPNKILSIELINNKIRLHPRNSFYNIEDILKINNK